MSRKLSRRMGDRAPWGQSCPTLNEEKIMKNELRRMFADGIRARKALGEGNNLICPKMEDYKAWALRSLSMDGPKGKLP